MGNPTLIKNYTAEGDIAAYRIVKFGAADGGVAQAAASTDLVIGVNAELPVVAGERVDVVRAGLADVEFGGTVARGQPVAADADGKADGVITDPGALGVLDDDGSSGCVLNPLGGFGLEWLALALAPCLWKKNMSAVAEVPVAPSPAVAGTPASAAPWQQRLQGMDRNQRLKWGGLAALVAVGVVAAAFFASSAPDYRVLFSNLGEKDGGSIIAVLEKQNTPFKLSPTGAIMVPAEQVHQVRLKLAAQGLPHGGMVGFELMENQKFGISQFAEQVNYQRGLEGELARTIMSIGAVQAAHHRKLALDGMGRGQQLGHRAGLGTHHIAGAGRDELVGGVGLPAFEHLDGQGPFKAWHVATEPAGERGNIEGVLFGHRACAHEVVKVAHVRLGV